MTKQHPLTDEICREVADSMIDFPNGFPDAHDHMRAGADWQLEQVIDWLNNNLAKGYYLSPMGCYDHEIDVDDLLDDLKEAMRPQQLEDN